MATKKAEPREMNSVIEFGRKVALAYVGMFGIASDKLGEWFDLFVERGQVIEKDARKMYKREEKQMRKLAVDLQKQEKAAVKKAEKSVKQTIKKVGVTA
ncbi:MAG: hypothetical protein BroJett039_12120 [Chloroflexota bacterium]|nr:MAG: hypothetical protein BroJett039_12120 [Chloroflexota bacterium]